MNEVPEGFLSVDKDDGHIVRVEPSQREVRVDVDVSAYVPSSYVPYEAAKIDIHRRIAGARAPGELRALIDELRDRFGPPPEAVESLVAIQRARIELARLQR
mgnify:CR=1 FL=1